MYKTQEKHFLWSIIIFLALKPIYLLPPGSIQICDIFLILCMLWSIFEFKGKLRLQYKGVKFVFFFMSVVLYQCVVNIMWYTTDFDNSFLFKPLFYIYNFFAFFFFVQLGSFFSINKLQKSIAYGAVVSSIVALSGVVLNQGSAVRGVGFFNNPNQLGFHGILILTLLFFTKEQLSKFWTLITLICSIFFVLASASKAAFGGIVCLTVAYILFAEKEINIRNILIKLFLLVVGIILLYVFFFVQSPVTDNNMLATMQYRLLNMAENPTSNLATGRGHARILEMGIHFPWGMGEGDYGRFSTLSFYEVHNLFINLFVSYGLIGFVGYIFIFGYALIVWNNLKISLYNVLGFSGIFIYSFTHNSIRNTIIFLLIALLLLQKSKNSFNIDTMIIKKKDIK